MTAAPSTIHDIRRPASATSSDSWMPITSMIDVGHSKLAYRRVGTGPDIVFVHGWPLHSATYREMLPLLSAQFTCHLFDLPGTGDTEWSRKSKISLREHAAALRNAIEQLGLTRYALVGHDSGGLIARLVAQNNPAVVAMAMGNTEVPKHVPWLVVLYRMVVGMPFGVAIFGALLGSRLFLRSPLALGGCFDDPNKLTGDFHKLFIAPLNEKRRLLDGQLRLLTSMEPDVITTLADVHADIKAPVQLIWGTRDPFFPLARAKDMMSQFVEGSQFVELPGKLLVHEEHPQAFCEAMVPFLQRQFDVS